MDPPVASHHELRLICAMMRMPKVRRMARRDGHEAPSRVCRLVDAMATRRHTHGACACACSPGDRRSPRPTQKALSCDATWVLWVLSYE